MIYSDAQVFQAAWWMQLYGSLTPKRHVAWCNAPTVKVLDLGVLAKETKERLSAGARKSAKTYRNKRGKKAFCGTRFFTFNTETWIQQNCANLFILCLSFFFEIGIPDYTPVGFGLCPVWAHLRTYPPKFARRIAKYYKKFCSKREAVWEDADSVELTAQQVMNLSSWEDDVWEDAGLPELFIYLRGSKSLNLSADWRPFFPTSI